MPYSTHPDYIKIKETGMYNHGGCKSIQEVEDNVNETAERWLYLDMVTVNTLLDWYSGGHDWNAAGLMKDVTSAQHDLKQYLELCENEAAKGASNAFMDENDGKSDAYTLQFTTIKKKLLAHWKKVEDAEKKKKEEEEKKKEEGM